MAHARLAILLDATGLSQAEAARFLGVQDRTLRRWLAGARATPADVIERLAALAAALDRAAAEAVAIIDARAADGSAALLIYRRDEDLPAWSGLPAASVHRSMMRRVIERRPGCRPVSFDRAAYAAWLGRRADTQESRALWAASVVTG